MAKVKIISNPYKLEQINDCSPKIGNYTWDHGPKTGEMRLVKTAEHEAARHTGGKSIWGGGIR